MKFVKLTADVGPRRSGEVLRVDEKSAASLVETKRVATYFDPTTDIPSGPAQVVGEPADGEDGEPGEVTDGDGVTYTELPVQVPSVNDPKPVLVARLVAATADSDQPLSVEEAERLTRAEIVAKLTS